MPILPILGVSKKLEWLHKKNRCPPKIFDKKSQSICIVDNFFVRKTVFSENLT